MKTIIVNEREHIPVPPDSVPSDVTFVLDLTSREIKDCLGCWTCWMRTPGRCAFHDLDDFYRAYLHADKVIFYIGVSCDFVSGKLKTLFDRMIPHFLPYTNYVTGESMHDTRYEHYPEIEVSYKGVFESREAQILYEEYLNRVFYQFHNHRISIHPENEEKERTA